MPDHCCRIRTTEERDFPAILEMLDELLGFEQDFAPDPIKQRRALRMLLARDESTIFTAENPATGEVLGHCSVQLLVSSCEGAYSGLIEDIVVIPAARGQGIGTQLLEAAIQWSVKHGATRMQLVCDDQNPTAARLYEHLGWERVHLWTYFLFPQKKGSHGWNHD